MSIIFSVYKPIYRLYDRYTLFNAVTNILSYIFSTGYSWFCHAISQFRVNFLTFFQNILDMGRKNAIIFDIL